jgi:hypothetical protein
MVDYKPTPRMIESQIKLLYRRGASGNEAQRALEGTDYQATRYKIQKIYSEMRAVSEAGRKANSTRNDYRPNSSNFPQIESFSMKNLHYGVEVILRNPETGERIERLISIGYDSDVKAGIIKEDAANVVAFIVEKYDVEIESVKITEAYRKKR